ncbi:MAG: DUF5694 domain-containing protein [Flavobacterium sp.]|uniref:DUF5694 domain-containing protein n=1 Tax=Flavobacterium sp. TaxID=239 RepID=UPI0025BE39F3|nr:DUF5694 domain-containing protein [Flavobacterium sp.]MCK6609162.1 DUF5694 domain-containing protein [Flavobacterium sp.]
MKKQFTISFLILCYTIPSLGQETIKTAMDRFPVLKKNTSTPIMILGTFHFNFAENVSDVKGENNFYVHSEKRQKELLILIKKIKKFNPTKIAVEMMLPDQPLLDSLFNEYLTNNWKLGNSEVYQIGFKLAKELRLKGVNCVDNRPVQVEVDTTIPDLELYASQRGELIKWEAYNEPNNLTNTYIDSLRTEMTITDYLVFLNNEIVKHRYKQFFLTGLVDVGVGHNYIEADLTGYWNRRNTRIFSNIKKLVVSENERILVIYGNSHAWMLEELFSGSHEFNVIKAERILK